MKNQKTTNARKALARVTKSQHYKITARAEKLTAKGLAKAEKERQAKNASRKTTDLITNDSLYDIAIGITTRAVLTDYIKSGNEKMRDLYFSCLVFAKSFECDRQGGADLIQDTALYLLGYIGKSVTDTTNDGRKDKEGNDLTILRGAFRNVSAKIKAEARKEYKRKYLSEFENDDGEINTTDFAIPFEWDFECYDDFIKVNEMIAELNLTAVEIAVLNLRMRGQSTYGVAESRGTSRQAVQKTLDRIQKKYIDLYGKPTRAELKTAKA